ncbi:uncharacterized protein EV420DRAFT_1480280 [Desarmillaria tabescens]|uniref:Uncharacterized protein n=1 Tax=Armillaria tabescens TaxID=1929756 RepID=A0AA39KDU3_ARMTA|nr:uncharacterized protein EV420DRAFT_1480280 [Desarmillaria tabescens]KAK0458130.1 hypothetical protein EV420DRAFT_1480280 [Desarmillaria tabescens]
MQRSTASPVASTSILRSLPRKVCLVNEYKILAFVLDMGSNVAGIVRSGDGDGMVMFDNLLPRHESHLATIPWTNVFMEVMQTILKVSRMKGYASRLQACKKKNGHIGSKRNKVKLALNIMKLGNAHALVVQSNFDELTYASAPLRVNLINNHVAVLGEFRHDMKALVIEEFYEQVSVVTKVKVRAKDGDYGEMSIVYNACKTSSLWVTNS